MFLTTVLVYDFSYPYTYLKFRHFTVDPTMGTSATPISILEFDDSSLFRSLLLLLYYSCTFILLILYGYSCIDYLRLE